MGTSFPTDGPGLSARMRFMVLPPVMGSTARINTITPIPPIQWVKLRQNRLHRDSASTSLKMLAPVVVNPEIVSNSASVKLGISPLNTNGRAPMALSSTQARVTTTNPSLV